MKFRVRFHGTICHVLDGDKNASTNRAILLKDEKDKIHQASLVIDQDYVSGTPPSALKARPTAHQFVIDISTFAVRFKGSAGLAVPDGVFEKLVPHLSAISKITELEPEVYSKSESKSWEYMQGYFQLPGGTLTAENPIDGSYSNDPDKTVQFPRRTVIHGETAEAQLEFSNDGEQTWISLDLLPQKDGVVFDISNWPKAGHHSHGGHWKLHYRLGKNEKEGPDVGDAPKPSESPRARGGWKILITGPGCANSTWP